MRTPRLLPLLPLFFFTFLVSCSHAPRMSQDQETDYVRMLRAEFFQTHPNGPFNEHIKRGEVVKGMDFLEVLASWGNPDVRQKPSDMVERWTYVAVDPDSKDKVQYDFIFRKNVLAEWELTRHFATGGNINLLQTNAPTSITKGDYTNANPQRAPKKQ